MVRLLLFLCFALLPRAGFAEEIDLNGNFQSAGKENMPPRGWWANYLGKKKSDVKMSISEPDGNGIRSFDVSTSENIVRFDIAGNKRLSVLPGDILIFSGETAGTGEIRIGAYAYGTTRFLGEIYGSAGKSETFKTFRISVEIQKIKNVIPDTVVPTVSFVGKGNFRIRNLKLEIQRSSGREAMYAKYRYYPVYKLSSVPESETGKEASLWKDIPTGRGFVLLKNDAIQKVRNQTSFQLAHDGKKLYLRILCDEPDMEGIVTDPALYRDGLRYDDQVEFAVTHDRAVPQSYFVFNSLGASYRANSSERYPVSIEKGPDSWRMNAAIPLDKLLSREAKFEFGEDYFFNIGRSNLSGGPLTHSSFAKGFGDKSKFAYLTFHDSTAPVNVLKTDEAINENYTVWQRETVKESFKLSEMEFKKKYEKYGTPDGKNLADYRMLKDKASKLVTPVEYTAFLKEWEKLDEVLRTARKEIALTVKNPSAIKNFYLNGIPVPVSAEMKFNIPEGVNVLSMETVPGEKIELEMKGHPETNGCWRISDDVSSAPGWKTVSFNDSSWKMADADTRGSFKAGKFARQILLWNRDHTGNERMFPMCREWLFSENSIDGMRITIYSPLAWNLPAFTVNFEFPENIRILEFAAKSKDTSLSPRKIDAVRKNGTVRYALDYGNEAAESTKTKYSYIPLEFASSDILKKGMEFKIKYFRRAGNFVELVQYLPSRVIPEINGRMPKKFKTIACRMWGMEVSDSYYMKLLEQLAKTGMNTVNLPTWISDGKNFELQRSLAAEKANALGMNIWVATAMYPIWGSHVFKGELYQYLRARPEAQAHRFGGEVSFGKPDKWWNYMFCPTYISTTGREEYIRCVKADFRKYLLAAVPLADAFWINWEGWPWRGEAHPYCFCKRCIENFAKRFNIGGGRKLTDKTIKENYYREWAVYRTELDGKIMELTRIAASELGKRLVIYSQTSQEDFWKGSRHSLDIVNPGEPGNGPGDSRLQNHMDYAMGMLHNATGTEVAVGQQMVPFYTGKTGRDDYKKEFLASNTSYMEPSIFKSVFIRMAASLHGGILWFGVLGGPVCGMHYYIGEATRLIAEYEPLFLYGKRDESLLKSKNIEYPFVLVLQRENVVLPEKFRTKPVLGTERLVLLFNEDETERPVTIENLKLPPGCRAIVWKSKETVADPVRMEMVIPPKDLVAIYLYGQE
ncbi:MAG: hypothetical protein BWY31_02230 [Lentisphaerae bacterium ADurb.Bin242]|nr:MAG: hypothetical protein BWY31_02230 [Lentisphaerae bacterium ADurb.Bin242]